MIINEQINVQTGTGIEFDPVIFSRNGGKGRRIYQPQSDTIYAPFRDYDGLILAEFTTDDCTAVALHKRYTCLLCK